MSMADTDDHTGRAHDWSARARTTMIGALRYSRFVAIMKRALSLGAFLVIAAVLAFFFIQRMPRQLSYERLGHVANDLSMLKPHLTGVDDKGHPYNITADAAVQDAKNPKRADLRTIEADLMMDKGAWLNANARHGVVDMSTGQLELDGGIDVFTDQGYQIHTQTASMNMKQSVIHGHQEVTGQGPDGIFRADEFHADRQSGLLTLSGHVRMTLIGKHT